MANTKISQLPIYSGNAADIRRFVMNNSGETETFKFSGYSSQLIPGTGTNSFRTPTALASGTRSISIGTGNETGTDSIMIGSGTNYTSSPNSVSIGKGCYMLGASEGINIGNGNANQGSYTLTMGGTYLGRTTRSMAEGALNIGFGNQNNEGYRSLIYGNLNSVGGGLSYNTIIGNNHSIIGSSNYNTIIGGNANTISGTTSGSTLIGLVNYTAPLRNDATYTQNLVLTNYAALDFADDTAAAAGGVVLGQVYHNLGALRIRIT